MQLIIDAERLEHMAAVIETWAAALRREQRKQLDIDPEWTTVEVPPELFEKLVTKMEEGAARLRETLETLMAQDASDDGREQSPDRQQQL